jgi:hypothetical protein
MNMLNLLLSLVALLSLTVQAEAWEVLVVDAAAEPGLEFQFLSDNVKKVEGKQVNYTQIVTSDLEKKISENYDVVWLGWNCSSDDGGYFREKDGEAIVAYVKAGGVLVTSATDNNGWRSDWLPAAVTVLDTGDYDLEITNEGKELFSKPNDVKPADPVMDERYSAIDKAWTILAWGVGMKGSEAGAIQIAHGKGLYLLVSIDTRNAGNTQSALRLDACLMHHVSRPPCLNNSN